MDVKTITFNNMVDISLGTPEVGAVNFRVLHAFLHSLLQELGVGDKQTKVATAQLDDLVPEKGWGSVQETVIQQRNPAELEDSPPDGTPHRPESAPQRSDYPPHPSSQDAESKKEQCKSSVERSRDRQRTSSFHGSALHEKISRIESQLKILNSLPDNQTLLERASCPKLTTPISDMWKMLNLNKRQESSETGIQKLSSLLEDLSRDLAALKSTAQTVMEDCRSLNRSQETLHSRVLAAEGQQEVWAELQRLAAMLEELRNIMLSRKRTLSKPIDKEDISGQKSKPIEEEDVSDQESKSVEIKDASDHEYVTWSGLHETLDTYINDNATWPGFREEWEKYKEESVTWKGLHLEMDKYWKDKMKWLEKAKEQENEMLKKKLDQVCAETQEMKINIMADMEDQLTTKLQVMVGQDAEQSETGDDKMTSTKNIITTVPQLSKTEMMGTTKSFPVNSDEEIQGIGENMTRTLDAITTNVFEKRLSDEVLQQVEPFSEESRNMRFLKRQISDFSDLLKSLSKKVNGYHKKVNELQEEAIHSSILQRDSVVITGHGSDSSEENVMDEDAESVSEQSSRQDDAYSRRLDALERSMLTQNGYVKKLGQTLNTQVEMFLDKLSGVKGEVAAILEKMSAVSTAAQYVSGGEEEAVAQDAASLSQVFHKIDQLESDMDTLNSTASSLMNNYSSNERHIHTMFQQLETLKLHKADKTSLLNALADKADMDLIKAKVSYEDFENMCEDLSNGIRNMLEKLTGQEEEWQRAVSMLTSEMDQKLNKMELTPLKNFVNVKLKQLQEKLKKEIADRPMSDDAAFTRKQLIRDLHCVACDKDVTISGEVQHPSIPHPDRLRGDPTSRPHTTYELDQVRKQTSNTERKDYLTFEQALQHELSWIKKRDQAALQVNLALSLKQRIVRRKQREAAGEECYSIPRFCGGSHTVISHKHRLSKVGGLPPFWSQEEPVYPITDIRGHDGRIYRGRLHTSKELMDMASVPHILKPIMLGVKKRRVPSSASDKKSRPISEKNEGMIVLSAADISANTDKI